MEEVSPRGKPILPEGIWARFRNVCGAIARDQLQTWITTNDWKKVPDLIKESLWAALQACFRFPEGKPKEDARKFVMITLGTAFRKFEDGWHGGRLVQEQSILVLDEREAEWVLVVGSGVVLVHWG